MLCRECSVSRAFSLNITRHELRPRYMPSRLRFYPSMHSRPPIHPSIHLSIHPSITSSIYHFIYLFFHASINVDPYMDFVGQSLCLCIYPLSRGFLLHGACVHVQIQLIHLPLHTQDSNHCDLSLHIWISTYSHTGCRKTDMYTYVYLCTYVYIYTCMSSDLNSSYVMYLHVRTSNVHVGKAVVLDIRQRTYLLTYTYIYIYIYIY